MRATMGILTPSSNIVLEPATSAMAALVPGVSAHFARFGVTKIALSADSNAQFEFEPMLGAAELLADAKVGVVAWSGTSASWLGFERDEALCAAIEERTGTRACTAVLAINELLALKKAQRVALVTPYTEDVHRRIAANYEGAGIEIVGGRFAGRADNYSFALLEAEEVKAMRRDAVADARADAIVLMCTNMLGWALMKELEDELGAAMIDSTAAVVWKALGMLGVDAAPLRPLGSMFEIPAGA